MNYFFDLEFLLKNLTFLTLFITMVSFWGELSFQTGNEKIHSSTDSRKPLSYNFFFISFLLLTFQLIFRWYSSNHIPLSNLYESLLFLSWTLLGLFLFFSQSPDIFPTNQQDGSLLCFFGGLVSSTVLFLQSFADWQLPNELRQIQPLVPALQSNWLLMHVSIMILSYASLLGGCLLAIAYLIIEFALEFKKENNVQTRILGNSGPTSEPPSGQVQISQSLNLELPKNQEKQFLDQIDSLSSRILSLAFPLLTLGILSGAVWANEAWGSYWSWDPKETWALITWLVFAFYIHTRLQYGWIGQKSARVAAFGFFIVWVCYLGVNLLGKGLHSYGWLSS